MKIIFCGPPHSGKSVFIANLSKELPTVACINVKACPDGEGTTWSNNKNQEQVSNVRKKGEFTQNYVDEKCKEIDRQTEDLVIVDVGGAMSKENEQIFRHCDSFVVISGDEEKKKEWIEFGKRLGLQYIGSIDSRREGEEEIYSREPYFHGKIVGLERGEELHHLKVIKALVSDLIEKSKYLGKEKEKDFDGILIDDTELGFELGYGKEIITDKGKTIQNVKWTEEAVSDVYRAIQQKIKLGGKIKINGVRANFILSAICKAIREQGKTDINVYDTRFAKYIHLRDIPKKRGLKSVEGLSYKLIQDKNSIFLDIDITKEQYSLEDYEKAVLPQLNEKKSLYLSGQIPNWLLASIIVSYDSNKIFTFQPGKGFTCVASQDKKELGTIVDGIDGININQYYEDKKEKRKSKLPAVVEKKGILSKIKRLFVNFGESRENSKYIDTTIKANTITQEKHSSSSKKQFQSELQVQAKEQPNTLKNEDKQSKTNEGVSIGG